MALIQNITQYNHLRLRHSAYHGTNERTQWSMLNAPMARSVNGFPRLNSVPRGYNPHYAWLSAIKAGDMSVSAGVIIGTGSIAPLNLAGGLNGQAAISGTCTVSASITAKGHIEVTIAGTSTCEGDLSGAVYMTATIAGTSSVSDADLRMIASMVATIAGQATVAGTLTGSVNIEATLTGEGLVYSANLAGGMYIEGTIAGEGAVEGDIIAKGNISATIVVNEAGATLTTDAIASAVWAALAANNNASGSMGELLNDAGGGSSPEVIADAVAAHAKTLTVPKYLGLK